MDFEVYFGDNLGVFLRFFKNERIGAKESLKASDSESRIPPFLRSARLTLKALVLPPPRKDRKKEREAEGGRGRENEKDMAQ